MDNRHQNQRHLYLDERHEKARCRQSVLDAISNRLQSFFITLRADFPSDADGLLRRAERQTLRLNHAP